MTKKPQTLRKAINQYCKECIYDSHSPGTWRQQTDACTGRSCPLYPVRPLSRQIKKEDGWTDAYFLTGKDE